MLNKFLTASVEKIEIGMGATRLMVTDRHPYTVVEIINDRTIVVQEDNARRLDRNGQSESQQYEFTPNPNGERVILTKRKDGRWVQKGVPLNAGSNWRIGERMKYIDPHW